MRIKIKLLITPVIIVVIFLANSFFVYQSFNKIIKVKDALSSEATEMETILRMRIDSGLIRQDTGEILLGEDRSDDLSAAWDSFYKNSASLYNLLGRINPVDSDEDDELVSEKGSADLLADIEKDSNGLQTAVYQIIDNYKNGNLELAKKEYSDADVSFDHFFGQLMDLAADNSAEIDSLGALVAQNQIEIIWFLIMVTIFVVIVSIVLSLINAKLISRELVRIKQVTDDILQGNINRRVNDISNDEVGDLARDFNQMIDKVHESQSGLEKKVIDKTVDLQKKLEELDKVNQTLRKTNQVMINRESKMLELKEKLKKSHIS